MTAGRENPWVAPEIPFSGPVAANNGCLKFNQSFEKCRSKGERAMRLKSLLKRLFDKIVHDAMPAALASILGGLLLTHFNIDRAPQPVTVKVMQASPEMMQLLRDEHGLMVDFAKEQAAGEKNRSGTEQVDRNDATEASMAPPAQVMPTPPLPRPMPVVALAVPKPAAPRSKNPVVAVSQPASAPSQPAGPAPQPEPQPVAARADNSLLAKTIGIKDQVVSVTQRAVSATVGVIPSWFGSLGDRIGGEGQSPRPPANLVSASWIMPSAADR
jgi:hypothetical protein